MTDVLQTWNRPRAKRVEPIPVDEMGDRRRELTKPQKSSCVIFDPLPSKVLKTTTQELDNLFTDVSQHLLPFFFQVLIDC